MLAGTQYHFSEENLQWVETVEAETQMFNSGQIQMKCRFRIGALASDKIEFKCRLIKYNRGSIYSQA